MERNQHGGSGAGIYRDRGNVPPGYTQDLGKLRHGAALTGAGNERGLFTDAVGEFYGDEARKACAERHEGSVTPLS